MSEIDMKPKSFLTEEAKKDIQNLLDIDSGGGGGGTSIEIDDTLTVEGAAADAKATGDAIANIHIPEPSEEQIAEAVNDWLEEHPEAITVQDGSITKAKLNAEVIDDTLSVSGSAADAKTAGDEISGLKNALTQLGTVPKIAGTDAVNVDLDITDTDGNVLARFANGHIQTKEFDSTDVNDDIADLKSGKIDIAQGVANAGKALVVGADGDVSPKDITIELDDTLTQQGEAADAKAVGDAIDDVEDSIAEVNYNLWKFPEIKNTSDADSDLLVTDSNGNAIVQFADGHIKTKNFDSENAASEQDIEDIEESISELGSAVGKSSVTSNTNAQDVDLDLADQNGNVLVRFEDGHIKTKNFDSSMSDQNAVKTVNNTAPDANGNVNVSAELDPEEIEDAVSDYLSEHPVVASAAGIVSVADYGAVGDGTTDDSAAIQNAVNSNYDVYFESNKTYYLASSVTINHDIKLHGGKNTVIKTKTPTEGTSSANNGIIISGTLKKTTTLTTNYLSTGETTEPNCSNRITLADMDGVEIGDILVIRATDQFYSYARQYYYLGGAFTVVDKYDGHLYISRNMPFDITLTSNVTVTVYDAPKAEIENLDFESDLNSFERSGYPATLLLIHCKNSVVRQCKLTNTQIGIQASYCVNTLFDGVQVAKSRWVNTAGMGDGYGIYIGSCTNTIVQRLVSLCAQGCVDLGGNEPNYDTYIIKSHISSECRGIGIDMHENSYNIVVEDCVMGGMSLYGTATVNRCQFIKNNRPGGAGGCITFRGSHDPRFAKLFVSNCTFDGELTNWLWQPAPQSPIQSFDNIIDSVVFEHCRGGKLHYDPDASSSILSNTINTLIINDWQDCYEIYHKADQKIKKLIIKDSSFIRSAWLNNHTNNEFSTKGIDTTVVDNTFPRHSYLYVNSEDGNGGNYVLPENVNIELSSDNSDTLFMISGENAASNNHEDYYAGTVSGQVGNSMTRTPNISASANITTDNSGRLTFTHPNNSNEINVYPRCMLYTSEKSVFRMSATLKNVGNTSGDSFRAYIIAVNVETGKIVYKYHGTSNQATADGAIIAHSYEVSPNCIVFGYFGNYNPVANAITAFEDFSMTLTPTAEQTPVFSEFVGTRIIGDGVLMSLKGLNHIMSEADVFNVEFSVDIAKGGI